MAQVGQDSLLEKGYFFVKLITARVFKRLERERKTGDFHRLGVNVYAKKVVEQNLAFEFGRYRTRPSLS